MVVSTAICFILAGLSLFLSHVFKHNKKLTITLTALGSLIVLISVLHAIEMLSGVQFGIDMAALHAPLQPEFANPGRMAPPTMLGFLFFGLSLIIYAHFRCHYWVILRALTRSIFMIGVLSLIAYWLKIEYLYNWVGVVRMAFHTALGMVVLSLGLRSLWIEDFQGKLGETSEEYAINRTAAMVLIVVALVSGLSGFAILQDRVEQVTRDNLGQLASDRRQFFEQLIQHRLERAWVIKEASDLRYVIDEAHQPDSANPILKTTAERLLTHGFTGVMLEHEGKRQLLTGRMLNDSFFSVRLNTAYVAQLIWNNGYYLRTRMPLDQHSGSVDYLIIDQMLPVIYKIGTGSIRLGKTVELVICQAKQLKLACFPMQTKPAPFMVPQRMAGVPLPMTRALSGEAGVSIARDFRGERVIAAYGPIGNLGLGMVIKMEVAEIYAPVKEQFQIMLPLMATLVLLGVWWMRRRIQPLVAAVILSKQSLINDIAERKKIEKMKNEFISTVSHELRTPLTSIRGSLGLLISGMVGEIPASAQSLLTIANKNCERLVRLINDILDIEKIESGNMRFNYEVQSLLALVEQAIAATQSYALQYHTEFILQTDGHKNYYVNGDSDRLIQVIINLLSNAAKFSYPHHPVKIKLSQSLQTVRVSVINHGKGIDKVFNEHIFQKFMQADSTDTRQKGGTGLGLNISRAIIEKHQGRIGFTSEPEVATEFYFELPSVSIAAPSLPENKNFENQGRVLICEDDPDIAKLLTLLLSQVGFVSDIAGNAAQARVLLAKNTYDAMTLDLGLPDETGFSLLEWLRKQEKISDLPVVIVSAKEEDKVARNALGVKEWIIKPIDEKKLIKTLQYALRLDNQTGKHSILHVEDDSDLASVIEKLLSPQCRVIHASTLAEAKEYLKIERFNAIILDLELPDGQGSELLNSLPAPNDHTPVIIFSAKEASEETFKHVFATLVKSRSSNEQLVTTLYHLFDISSPFESPEEES
ncbi:MAG: response regulator [Pseudomonadota bacterium]